MPGLSFEEIKDWQQFEELGTAYFRNIMGYPEMNIISIDVKPSGAGPDGGKDLIAQFIVPDFIKPVTRKWIVQFKFKKNAVSTDSILDINIPTLIHSCKASGYLLICNGKPSNKLVELFNGLTKNCNHGYHYEIWSGERFREKLISAPDTLHKQFFPKYYAELEAIQKKNNQ